MHQTFLKSFARASSQIIVKGYQCSLLQIDRNIYSSHCLCWNDGNRTGNKSSEGEIGSGARNKETMEDTSNSKPKSSGWGQFATKRYSRFAESSARVIYDFQEEQERLQEGLEIEELKKEARVDIPLERGERGVFDAEELVDLLREENAKDIVVIKVPVEMKYVEHIVIATGKSERHLNALSQLIVRIYKKKKLSSDSFTVIEGKNTGWNALDMGNIALHIMNEELRENYDLETLWTVGSQYDEQCQKENMNSLDILRIGNLFEDNSNLSHISPGNNQNLWEILEQDKSR